MAFICSQKIKISYNAENIPDEPETVEVMGKMGNLIEQVYPNRSRTTSARKEFVGLMSDMAALKWEKGENGSKKLRPSHIDGAVVGDYYAFTLLGSSKKTGQDETGDFYNRIS